MKALIAGNWKMNTTTHNHPLSNVEKDGMFNSERAEILIIPPFTSLESLSKLIKGTPIKLGAQDMHQENSGAYTGCISAEMLTALGCEYVLLGHSEVRQYLGETDARLNLKMKQAFKHKLTPILCVGESLEERESGQEETVVSRQLREGLAALPLNDHAFAIAYEPVWAIGTGKVATPAQAQAMHAFIRKQLSAVTQKDSRILYGGSVKPGNTEALMAEPDIDGLLVGGASLTHANFCAIINNA